MKEAFFGLNQTAERRKDGKTERPSSGAKQAPNTTIHPSTWLRAGAVHNVFMALGDDCEKAEQRNTESTKKRRDHNVFMALGGEFDFA